MSRSTISTQSSCHSKANHLAAATFFRCFKLSFADSIANNHASSTAIGHSSMLSSVTSRPHPIIHASAASFQIANMKNIYSSNRARSEPPFPSSISSAANNFHSYTVCTTSSFPLHFTCTSASAIDSSMSWRKSSTNQQSMRQWMDWRHAQQQPQSVWLLYMNWMGQNCHVGSIAMRLTVWWRNMSKPYYCRWRNGWRDWKNIYFTKMNGTISALQHSAPWSLISIPTGRRSPANNPSLNFTCSITASNSLRNTSISADTVNLSSNHIMPNSTYSSTSTIPIRERHTHLVCVDVSPIQLSRQSSQI